MQRALMRRVYVAPQHMSAGAFNACTCFRAVSASSDGLQRTWRHFSFRNAYRALLLIYGLVFCGGYIPVMLWIMPDEPFAVGEVYVWGRSWRPVTKLRSEVEVSVPLHTITGLCLALEALNGWQFGGGVCKDAHYSYARVTLRGLKRP